MFKAKKSRPLASQRTLSGTSQSTNTENESENIPLAQRMPSQIENILPSSNDDDDAFIAPSQGPSLSFHDIRSQRRRRFVSQRSQMRYETSQSQGLSISKRIAKSYFEQILMKTEVNFNDDFYLLNCDVFRFQNRFEEVLCKADNYPENISVLINDVKTLLANSKDAWHKLMATIRFTVPESDENSEIIVHESIGNSMLRFLLQNKHLQRPMFEVFFNEIRKLAKPQCENDLMDFALVIRQMQFVDFRDNSDYIFREYFEILPQCNMKAREILIGGIDDFVELAKHSSAMKKIMEEITALDELFTIENLKVFGNLCLSTECLNKVRHKIIHYMKNGAPKLLLQPLLTFLAKFNEDETDTYFEVINDIRNSIKWDMEESDIKISLIKLVSRAINRCEVTRKSWLKAITYVGNARNHKIIDPIACFIIGKNEDDAASIESFFKKRVKEKLFTVDLIQQMARHAPEILPEYVTVMSDIFKACFCERDKYTAFFGSIGFRVLFKTRLGDIDHRYPLQRLIALACMRPKDMPFMTTDNDIRTNSLELLLEIKRKLKSQADGGFVQIEKILDRSSYLTIDQYRILIKILCSLAYDGRGNETIKTDLELMAPKYVTNMHLRIKLQGIIIIFQILDKTMWTDSPIDDDSMNFSNDTSSSIISLSQIPIDSDLSNAKLLKLSLKASERNTDALMLYYDELASIVSPRNKSMTYGLNGKFIKWLFDQVLIGVQDTFVVTECPERVSDVPMEYFYNINSGEDEESVNADALIIGINIGGIVFDKVNLSPIHLMCPMFNALASMTYRRYNTSLETISALLGCSLVLPKNFFQEDEFLNEFGSQAIDIYFHVANWFRCVISSFATQGERSLKKKVLKRINQLIEVEASIKYLLQKCDPSYEPPPTTFQIRDDFTFVKPIGVPKKARKIVISDDEDESDEVAGPSRKKQKKRGKATIPADVITQFDEESMNLNATIGNLAVRSQFNVPTQGTQSAEVVKHRAKYWFFYGAKEKYRQLDIDIMILLEEKLEICYPVPASDIGECLYLQELKFVLADLISKTESISGVKKFRSEQQTQNLVSIQAYIHDLVMSLKYVVAFKKQLSTFIREKISEADSDDSAIQFSDLLNHVKICFGSCLHLFAALFSWPGFTIDDNLDLLKHAMKAIAEPESVCNEDEVSLEEEYIEEIAEKTLNAIIEDETSVMDLRSAVHLLHLAKILASFADKPEAVIKLAEKLLKREWFYLDGSKECNKNADIYLTEILKCFVRDMELQKLEEILEVFAEEMINLKRKGDIMPTYPNFYRSNCTIFYRVLAATCEQAMKQCVATVVRTRDLLECWKRCFDVLQVLLVINERNPILTNTSTFLRYSHSIMKIFRSNGVKAMEKMVNRNQQSVQDLLKSMQKTTRFLHNLSCDTKTKSNSRVLKQVPKLRETMEMLVVEVKSTLAGNHALSGFWVSNLTNKNVHGEVLLSQIEHDDDENDGEDEPEIVDDVESPDETSDVEDKEPEPVLMVSTRRSKIFD